MYDVISSITNETCQNSYTASISKLKIIISFFYNDAEGGDVNVTDFPVSQKRASAT